ncbi:unnamed protein product (macronuclear) [Paramecium tetraurelia]|uniref:Sec23/Sec24 trunk domain-containing protein n=1 Tax=Paramecium tetraurelia TaxID=5888 RepID=A0CZH9_PARTE|nr:uncharacterized protein GSPATT00011769001 [Paramecium tetraurelia]CAK76196.1 unnamed protein product [Paramecium tetraurelia]|eukprot:XP_001443593.1 hypothetical protein (macronuclear) [Paramecium tetraurelia strain d4-2]
MRPPMAPAYFFMIDMSQKSQELLGIMGQIIKDMIVEDKLNQRTLLGFIMFNTCIHSYNFNSKIKQVQMYVLTDDNEMPTPDDYLYYCGLSESIGQFISQTKLKSTQFISAFNFAFKIMQDKGGKLIILTSSPIKELNLTDNSKSSQNRFLTINNVLKQITGKMHLNCICSSIFVLPCGFNNVVTLNQLVKFLNGDIFFYDDTAICSKLKGFIPIQFQFWREIILGNQSSEFEYQLDGKLIYRIVKRNESTQSSLRQFISISRFTICFNPRGEKNTYSQFLYSYSDFLRAIYSQIDQSCLEISLYIRLPCLNQIVPKRSKTVFKPMISQQLKPDPQLIILRFSRNPLILQLLYVRNHEILNYAYDQQLALTDYMISFRSIIQYTDVDELITYIHRQSDIQSMIPQLYNISILQEQDYFQDENGYFTYPQPISLVLEEVSNGGLLLMDCGYYLILFICKSIESLIIRLHDESQIGDIFGKQYYSLNLVEDNLYFNSKNPINDKLHYLITELRKQTFNVIMFSNKYSKYASLYIVKQGCKSYWEEVFFQNLIYDDFNKNYRMDYNQFVKYIG